MRDRVGVCWREVVVLGWLVWVPVVEGHDLGPLGLGGAALRRLGEAEPLPVHPPAGVLPVPVLPTQFQVLRTAARAGDLLGGEVGVLAVLLALDFPPQLPQGLQQLLPRHWRIFGILVFWDFFFFLL